MLTVDLNCDLGEGMLNDEELMPFISSANIACGYHAGDIETIRKTVRLALKYNVAIGAHPGFNDKPNFGRTEMHLSANRIYELTAEQVSIIQKVCSEENATLHHVKPHGALYNMAAKNTTIAAAIAQAVLDAGNHLILYGLSGSYLISEAQKTGLKTASEVFADRTYNDDGSLTPRSQPGALLTNHTKAVEQVLQMITKHSVSSLSGKSVPIKANTICIHGDSEHAVDFARLIKKQLHENQIEIKST